MRTNVAVTVHAPVTVSVVDAAVELATEPPETVHFEKLYPVAGVAVIVVVSLYLTDVEFAFAVPPAEGSAFIVTVYVCFSKVAVTVQLPLTVTVTGLAVVLESVPEPLIDHFVNL